MASWEYEPTLEQIKDEYSEAMDIFPALHKYQVEHSADNLRKLCVEIGEFITAVIASTKTETERQILYDMLDKLNKR